MRANRFAILAGLPAIVVAGAVPAGAEGPKKETTAWTYVARDDGSLSAPFGSLPLSREKPEGLLEKLASKGGVQHYAQIHYGSENSTRVIVVLDDRGDGAFDLYVDRDRDRVIDEGDRVAGSGETREADLEAEIMHGEAARHVSRKVLFRRGRTRKTLSFATAGFAEGHIRLAGADLRARRVDGDGNGLFSDARDRLWIDLNADGRWDAISEQFPFLPVMRLADRRYAVRGDALGTRMALQEIAGEGRVQLRLATLAAGARIEKLEVMLAGDDGSAFTLQGADEPSAVPVGKYMIAAVSASLADDDHLVPLSFVFSRSGSHQPERWFEIQEGKETVLDPVGRLDLQLHLSSTTCRPGDELSVTPRLYTEEGLLINFSARGDADRWSHALHNCLTVHLQSPGRDKTVASTTSGFA